MPARAQAIHRGSALLWFWGASRAEVPIEWVQPLDGANPSMYITHLVPITSYLRMEQNYSYTLPYPTPSSYMLIFGWAGLGSLSDVISSHQSGGRLNGGSRTPVSRRWLPAPLVGYGRISKMLHFASGPKSESSSPPLQLGRPM